MNISLNLQAFGRLFCCGRAYLSVHAGSSNLSTTSFLYSLRAPAGSPVLLPRGFNAPSPFGIFIKEKLKDQTGGKERLKVIAMEWKNLNDVEKAHYVDSSKKLREQRRQDFEQLSDQQQKELIDQHENKTAKLCRLRKMKSLHKLYDDTKRPKNPMSSYIIFAKERYEKLKDTLHTNVDLVNLAKENGERWRQMTELERQPYVDLAKSNLTAYHQQMDEWKQKHESKVQELRKANETKKKKADKGGKRVKKSQAKVRVKANDGEQAANLTKKAKAPSPKKVLSVNDGEKAANLPKKAKAPSPKKVKKSDVKGAID